MQIAYVRWRDAYLNEGWHTEAGIEQIKSEPVWIVESVGWLIDQNEDRLIICGSVSSAGSCAEILKIPAEAIIELLVLSEPDAPNGEGVIDPSLPTLQCQETVYMDTVTND